MLIVDKSKYYYIALPEELKAFGLNGNYIVIKDKFFQQKLRMKCYEITKACVLRCLLYSISNIATRWLLKDFFHKNYYFRERKTQRIMNTGDCIEALLFGDINLLNQDYSSFILDITNYFLDFNDFRIKAINISKTNVYENENAIAIHLTGSINETFSNNCYLDLD